MRFEFRVHETGKFCFGRRKILGKIGQSNKQINFIVQYYAVNKIHIISRCQIANINNVYSSV